MNPSTEHCAAELLDLVPLLMRLIRANVRNHRGPEMSVPQFRTLAFIGRNKGATLSEAAAHLGLTLPSASKLVDGLVSARLATRKVHALDRRSVALALTAAGEQRYNTARKFARNFLAQKLAALGPGERARLFSAIQSLKRIFSDKEIKQTATLAARRKRMLRRSFGKGTNG